MLTQKQIEEFERSCLRHKINVALLENDLAHAKKFNKTDAEIMDIEVKIAKAYKLQFENYARLQMDFSK